MALVEDIKILGDLARRFESYRLEFEAQIARLKAENTRLADEVRRLRQSREPSFHRVAQECKSCLFRIFAEEHMPMPEAEGKLAKGDEDGTIKVKGG
jgi:hypothetical protein